MPNDFELYLQNQNPFASPTNVGGKSVLTSPSFGDLQKAGNWATNERNKRAAIQNAGQAYLSTNVFAPDSQSRTGFTSTPWSALPPSLTNPAPYQVGNPYTAAAPPGPGGIPVTSAGDLSTISLTKDPDLEARINKVLAGLEGANVGEVLSRPRSERLEENIGQALKKYQGDVNDATQSIEDFTNDFLSLRPEDTRILEQENRVLGNFFGGPEDPASVEAQLAGNLDQRRQAVSNATGEAMNILAKSGKLKRLIGGDSSFNDRQLMDAAAQILAQEQIDQSSLGRQNILDLANLRAGTAGQRGNLMNSYLQRGLAPVQADLSTNSALLSQLQALTGMDLSNIINQYPEELLSRELGLLGQASNLRRGIREEGVTSDSGYDFTGLQPIQSFANPGASVNPFAYAQDYGDLTGYGPLRDTTGASVPNSGALAGLDYGPEAASWYREQTGYSPEEDPNLNLPLLRNAYNWYDAGGNQPQNRAPFVTLSPFAGN